ncbi:MAG: DUF1295 domain-containing protein [Nocardioidaceae bacterium]|nr:DUF1295 domain-containing protein [Nocardioidaceae bacterium]
MTNDLTQSVATLVAGFCAVFCVMAVTMAWAVSRRRLSVVDPIWGAGFVVVAVVSFAVSTGGDGGTTIRWLLLVLPAAWGVRLAWHIARRNAGAGEDPRYQDLVDRSPHGFARTALTKVFLPQGVAMWLVALPVMVGMNDEEPVTWLVVAGVAVWAIGLFFEAVGDWQLARFKADPANKGQVMDQGLWRYTRHPNYFGDATLWWGIWLVAASSWVAVGTVIGPLAMTYLLAKGTGKPLTEKSMSESKPGYADYVRRTSGFVPLPPRDL